MRTDGGDVARAPATALRFAPDAAPDLTGLGADQRATLAAGWTRSALDEHASIAAFAAFQLDLMAHGAPAEILEGAVRAGLDELRHAKLAFALASAFAGAPVGPGALPAPHRPAATLADLAVATFRDGCVNETLAAAIATAERAAATDPAVRAALDEIVADETRHARLAWQTVAWALAEGGRPVREAVLAAARELEVPDFGRDAGASVPSHGLLGAADRREVAEIALLTVLRPVIDALLA